MTKKTIQIIIILVIIVVAFFGFKYFYADKQTGDTSLVADGTSAKEFADGQAILVLLNKLKLVTLDQSIFSNKTFISLESSERALDPQVFERKNPFFPIGMEGSGVLPTKVSTSTKPK